MMRALIEFPRKSRIPPGDAAKLLGGPPQSVSDLLRGKIHSFSVDDLIQLLTAAGLRADLRVK